eukprot:1613098-Ditylum_brightwellii.AAC.1
MRHLDLMLTYLGQQESLKKMQFPSQGDDCAWTRAIFLSETFFEINQKNLGGEEGWKPNEAVDVIDTNDLEGVEHSPDVPANSVWCPQLERDLEALVALGEPKTPSPELLRLFAICLLYTSDAADELDGVDL